MAGSAQATSSTKRLDLERRAFLDLLRMANTLAEPKELARQLVVLAQHLSGCEAVAVRLKSGPGFPYAAHLGFKTGFISLESDLCATDEGGRLLRVATDRGSFITTATSELLASPEAGCLGQTRNRCCADGYETLGLFPIRRDDVTYGLIQCNDSRPGRLTAESIDLMEHLAASAAHLFQLTMA